MPRRFHTNVRRGGAFRAAPIGVHVATVSSLAFSVPFYQPQDYPIIRAKMLKAPRSSRPGTLPVLPPDYQQWAEWVELQFRSLRRRGALIVRVTIEPDSFFTWCETHNRPINTDSAEVFAYERQVGAKKLKRQREYVELLNRVAERPVRKQKQD